MSENPFILLGVNIDHIATIRQARGALFPEPIQAALIAEQSGADGITAHLREDRRHIQDRDILILREAIHTRLNLEMAVTDEMIDIAKRVKPHACCLVPEKREELTTEGGLDVIANSEKIYAACNELGASGCQVSLFINPDIDQIDGARKAGAPVVELHTGQYANAENSQQRYKELERVRVAAAYANQQGLHVNAGHGLNYHNVEDICTIPEIVELNIGHSIIARSVLTGMEKAVRDMKLLMRSARSPCLTH